MPLLRPRQIPTQNPGAEGAEREGHAFGIRAGLAAFGGVLGIFAVWLLAAEIMRPALSHFPTERDDVASAAASTTSAAAAAAIGWGRGDLWLDDALAKWSQLSLDNKEPTQAARQLDEARLAARRAARLAPHDSRGWLVLAAIETRLGAGPGSSAAALKMSYYTGPSDIALVPLRLSLSVRPDIFKDAELRSLVENEFRMAVAQPGMRSGILWAYGQTSTDGRRVLEEIVAPLDARLLKDLRASIRKPS